MDAAANTVDTDESTDRLELAKCMLQLFRGRSLHVALERDTGEFFPREIDRPLHETPQRFLKHLTGEVTAGFYLLDDNSHVRCAAVDIDNKPHSPNPEWRSQTEKLYNWLKAHDLSPLCELSASGNGAHVWVFFSSPIPASVPIKFFKAIEREVGVTFREIFPKQPRLTTGGLGNLIRYPLGGKNKSQFVSPEGDWDTLCPFKALESVSTITEADLRSALFEHSLSIDEEDDGETGRLDHVLTERAGLPARVRDRLRNAESMLARRWGGDTAGLTDVSRSGLFQALAYEMVRAYIPTPDAVSALRQWGREHGMEQVDRPASHGQPSWLERSLSKSYEFANAKKKTVASEVSLMSSAVDLYIDSLSREGLRHIPSGIAPLDSSISGIAPGEFAIAAGRPSHGKTILLMQWIQYASSMGIPCLLISEEMSAYHLAERTLLFASEVNQKEWDASKIPDLKEQARRHFTSRAPIYIATDCHSIERVEEVITQYCQLHGTRFIGIDYLQLISSGKKGARHEELSAITVGLRRLCGSLGCGILCLSQMNREVDNRPGRKPVLSDLGDSGGQERDADLVMFLQHPYRWDSEEPEDRYLIFVEKRRNGAIMQPEIETTLNLSRQRIGT